MSKPIVIYHIAPHYRMATVWEGSRMSHARMCVSDCTPNKHLNKEKRHAIIAKWLYSEFGIPAPVFNSER